jgi:signal transduction histidine kinase
LPEGGTISVTTEYEPASHSDSADPQVVLTVVDNGTGMSPDTLQRAFEPFFTTKLPEHGSGLGLATVHAIVTGAGGQVAIDSHPEIGTTVRVSLPGYQVEP